MLIVMEVKIYINIHFDVGVRTWEELKKALHCGGNMLCSMGIHNSTKYNVMTCNDASGSFVIAQDLKNFQENLNKLYQDWIQQQVICFSRVPGIQLLMLMLQFCVISMHIMIL